jgi:hypothetical protein
MPKMKKIFKYKLVADGEQSILMPRHAEVTSVIEQNGDIIVYAIVDVNNQEVPHKFCVLGTGWDASIIAEKRYAFLQTVKVGTYVWHVFVGTNV